MKALIIPADCFSITLESELTDCWKDILSKVKIKVERCGCNAGMRLGNSGLILTAMIMPIFVAIVVIFRD